MFGLTHSEIIVSKYTKYYFVIPIHLSRLIKCHDQIKAIEMETHIKTLYSSRK